MRRPEKTGQKDGSETALGGNMTGHASGMTALREQERGGSAARKSKTKTRRGKEKGCLPALPCKTARCNQRRKNGHISVQGKSYRGEQMPENR